MMRPEGPSRWFNLAIPLATVLAIHSMPPEFPFIALRLVLDSVFLLFTPRYVNGEIFINVFDAPLITAEG